MGHSILVICCPLRDSGELQPVFDCRQGQEIFLFFTASRPALGAPSPELKLSAREVDHSPTSSSEIKNIGVVP
jgi:hypothetical protein